MALGALAAVLLAAAGTDADPASPPPPIRNHTCAGKCGEYRKHWECQCNSKCVEYKDCCADYHSVCPPGPSPSPGPHPHPTPSPPPSPSGPTGGPEQFHLSLTAEPTAVTVMFATAPNFYLSAAPPTCTLGTAPGQLPRSFSGKSRTYTDGGWEGLLHVVTLSNLAADGKTRYYYSCDGSAEFSFVSPPAPGSLPLTIAAVADLGSNCDKLNKAGDGSIGGTQGCGNATIDALATAVAKHELDLLVHAGDIAYTSGKQAIWDQYLLHQTFPQVTQDLL